MLTHDSDLKAGTTPKATSVKLQSARPAPASRHTRNARNPLPEFCEKLKVGENIIARIAEEEKSYNPDEEYFVAKIEERAKKLEEDGTFCAVPFKKNDWIVLVRWYNFAKKNPGGDRFYKKGEAQCHPFGPS